MQASNVYIVYDMCWIDIYNCDFYSSKNCAMFTAEEELKGFQIHRLKKYKLCSTLIVSFVQSMWLRKNKDEKNTPNCIHLTEWPNIHSWPLAIVHSYKFKVIEIERHIEKISNVDVFYVLFIICICIIRII